MSTPKFLVIPDEDFGIRKPIYRTDLLDSESEADWHAQETVKEGSRSVHVFKLLRVYVPADSRFVEVVHVDSPPSINYGGSGGED